MNLQHERISDAMERLKLTALATEWSGVADQFSGDDNASHADFIEALLAIEIGARQMKTRETLRRFSSLPSHKTLTDFDFKFATGAPKQQLQELAGLAFIE